jgi:hypothetical protein
VKLTSFRLNYRVEEVGQNAGLVVDATHGTSGAVGGKVLRELELAPGGVIGTFREGENGPAVRMVFTECGYGIAAALPAAKGGK